MYVRRMIPAIDQSIWSNIIMALLRDPGLTAETLRARVSTLRGESVTVQGVYKDLRRLQSLRVVYKSSGRFHLSLSWLLDSRELIEQGIAAHSKTSVITNFLPEPGESRSWGFSDIHAMDRFVSNMVLALQLHGTSKTSFHWVPYPWFAAYYPDRVQPFLKEFKRSGLTAHGILGAKSRLTHEIIAAQRPFGHQWRIGAPTFKHSEDTSLTIKPPFILSVRYPKKAVEVFRKFFALRNPPSPEAYTPFHDLEFQKMSYRVTISNNEKRAESLAEALTISPPRSGSSKARA
ncbi:MAG: hypothetical protein RL326_658 [Pseudomonadota bacterium]